jgi:DNA polymerase-3 subunit beta
MRFAVARDALGEAVAFVSRVLPSRPVVPVLSGMLIEAAGEGLTISCFDYEVSARCRIEAEVAEPGTALVPGRLLAEITRSLPARPVEFADDGELLRLDCGSAEFELVCLPLDEYPALPDSPAKVGTVDASQLASAVAQVASSASRDDTLPMLTAVCLDIEGDSLTLAATDRYRLAARHLAFAPSDPEVKAIALVPARVMTEAARALAGTKQVTLAFDTTSEGLISFEASDRRITARLIGGEFIKYQSRFSADFACQADLLAGPVIEAVRRAALVADRAGPVRLSFGAGHVVVEAHAEGRARAAEKVPADFTGDQPVISFNPHYLLEGLIAAASARSSAPSPAAAASAAAGAKEADGDEGPGSGSVSGETGRIRIQFNSPAKPALITWVDEGAATSEASNDPADAAGAAGLDGSVDPDGSDGSEGSDGSDGSDGSEGSDGSAGSDGSDGSDGSAGPDGSDGSEGFDGSAGADGSDGSDGSAGPDRSDGSAGSDGSEGSAGSDGSEGSAGSDLSGGAGGVGRASGVGGAAPEFRYLLVPLRLPDRT